MDINQQITYFYKNVKETIDSTRKYEELKALKKNEADFDEYKKKDEKKLFKKITIKSKIFVCKMYRFEGETAAAKTSKVGRAVCTKIVIFRLLPQHFFLSKLHTSLIIVSYDGLEIERKRRRKKTALKGKECHVNGH